MSNSNSYTCGSGENKIATFNSGTKGTGYPYEKQRVKYMGNINEMKEIQDMQSEYIDKLKAENKQLKYEIHLMDSTLIDLASMPTHVGRLAKERIAEIREKIALSGREGD